MIGGTMYKLKRILTFTRQSQLVCLNTHHSYELTIVAWQDSLRVYLS